MNMEYMLENWSYWQKYEVTRNMKANYKAGDTDLTISTSKLDRLFGVPPRKPESHLSFGIWILPHGSGKKPGGGMLPACKRAAQCWTDRGDAVRGACPGRLFG